MRRGTSTSCRAAIGPVALWVFAGLSVSGCATSPDVDVMIEETSQGAVYLERLPDRSVQATHPITLAPETVARILRGVMVHDNRIALQSLLNDQPRPTRVFSEEDVVFLAPLLATALSRAAPDQQAGFRIVAHGAPSYSTRAGAGLGSSEPPLALSPREVTAGTLFAHGQSLHLTITQYRRRAERADTINMANRRLPDPSGLNQRTVFFVPAAARRDDSYRTAHAEDTTLVIDYNVLAKLPRSETAPSPAASRSTGSARPLAPGTQPAAGQPPSPATSDPHEEELRAIKDLIIKKEMELEEVKKELQEIRRHLADRDVETDSVKRKTKPGPKGQNTTP
jgi:hypothetical protein